MTGTRLASWLLAFTVFSAAVASSARADVVFRDDYAARPDFQDIWGTTPTTTTPGVGAYVPILTFPYSGKIDPFTPVGKVLKFDTQVGDPNGLAKVPYAYAFGTDTVRLSVTAAHRPLTEQPLGFNNFAIGFAMGDSFTDHILVQLNQIQLNFPGVNVATPAIAFSSQGNTFYEFVLEYDPTLAGIAGAQPYSLSIDGVDIAIPVAADTVYTPLVGFDGVAFGGRFSNEITVRYLIEFALETVATTAIPEPGSLALFGAGLAGAALARRRRRLG